MVALFVIAKDWEKRKCSMIILHKLCHPHTKEILSGITKNAIDLSGTSSKELP